MRGARPPYALRPAPGCVAAPDDLIGSDPPGRPRTRVRAFA
ncbi:hypothetical protein [Streptomyces sp. NEAU-NA10]